MPCWGWVRRVVDARMVAAAAAGGDAKHSLSVDWTLVIGGQDGSARHSVPVEAWHGEEREGRGKCVAGFKMYQCAMRGV